MDNDDALVGRILSRRDILTLFGMTGLIVMTGCGRGLFAATPAASLPDATTRFPGLPALPYGAADTGSTRGVSLAADNVETGSAASSLSTSGSSINGTQLNLAPVTAGSPAWGLWSWGVFGAADSPSQLMTEVASGAGSYWVLLSNYGTGRWEVHGPFTGSATIAYTAASNYVSPAGGSYAAIVVAGTDSLAVNSLNLQAVTTPNVIATPAVTEGPFFVDENLNRSNIIGDTSRASVTTGLPFYLQFIVYEMNGDSVTPLAGAHVDIWHADGVGTYSDEASGGIQGESTLGQTWLRGYQVTDSHGAVNFTTIYPGWYTSRAVHIHFKIRLYNGATKTYEFSSQVFFDDSLSDSVLASAPYNTRGNRSVRNATDMVYTEVQGGTEVGPLLQLAPVAADGGGYSAGFVVGLELS